MKKYILNYISKIHTKNVQYLAFTSVLITVHGGRLRNCSIFCYFVSYFPGENYTELLMSLLMAVKLCINAEVLQTSASVSRWKCLLAGCCGAEWSKIKMKNKWEWRSNDEGCNRNDSSWRSKRRNELQLTRNNMDRSKNTENNQKWIKCREIKEEKL